MYNLLCVDVDTKRIMLKGIVLLRQQRRNVFGRVMVRCLKQNTKLTPKCIYPSKSAPLSKLCSPKDWAIDVIFMSLCHCPDHFNCMISTKLANKNWLLNQDVKNIMPCSSEEEHRTPGR